MVFTFAGESFITILHNWVAHMQSALPSVHYEAHAADTATFAACQGFARAPGRCVLTPLEIKYRHFEFTLEPGNEAIKAKADDFQGLTGFEATYYHNPFYRHKVTLLIHVLRRSPGGAIMLDAMSLIASPQCLSELTAFREDVVTSSETAHPTAFADRYGRVANTGASFFRRSALRLIELWRNRMPQSVLSERWSDDQFHFNMLLMRDLHFNWSVAHDADARAGAALPAAGDYVHANHKHPTFAVTKSRNKTVPKLMDDDPQPVWPREASPVGTVRGHGLAHVELRFLSLTHWPRVANRSEGACLYHPFTHSDREGVFRAAGWWYL